MQKKPSFPTQIIIGALLVTTIIGAASIWVTSGAISTTNKAANKVTEFYLRELAGRRSQMVQAAINEEFEEMERVLELVEPADLVSQDTLRSFLGKTETAYGSDEFAFVDEDDVVYTRYTTYSGGSRYGFLSDGTLDEGKVISTTDIYGASKRVCLAVPISGLTFLDKGLKACFVEVNIEEIVQGLDFDAKDANTSFCMYYQNGENLTSLDFGSIGAGQNLYETMHATLGEGEWDEFSKSFAGGKQGGVEFSYNGVRQTLYYAPVPETNWVLTVLVADNLIQDQVRSVGSEMVARSSVLIIVTGLTLLAFFVAIIIRTRKQSAALLEIERKNTRDAGERAQRSERELGEVKQIAYKDALTGAKNKHAYSEREIDLDMQIREGTVGELAVVVCDLNGLKFVNDTYGHKAGDEYIRSAYKLICGLFEHDSVYRIGGDEFVILMQGSDYEHRDRLLGEFNRRVEKNIARGEVVIAAGMAEREPEDELLQATFRRADERMYYRKAQLKKMGAKTRE